MQLDKAIQERKSTRKFNSKKPDYRDIIECIDAARYAPMAGGIYSPRFIVIDNPKTIELISKACQQNFVKYAQFIVVVCSYMDKTLNSFEEQGEIYARQQAGAAIQNFLLKLQEKKLSTCWVGHFVERLIKQATGIPDNVPVEAVFPIGYEYRKEKPKSKVDLNVILFFNKYKNKQMTTPKTIDP